MSERRTLSAETKAKIAAKLRGNKYHLKHGHRQRQAGFVSKTYESWVAMLMRCFNPKNNRFYLYGARGVTVCQRWRESFEEFLADMGERPEGKTLDRINPDGNYEPGNCRWATAKEQGANRRGRPRRRRPLMPHS